MLNPLIKIGSVVLFLALLVGYIWYAGRIPPPRESDRVSHQDGIYSIITPRGWEHVVNYAPVDQRYIDTLEVRFPTPRPRDRRIFVGRFREPPDLEPIKARDKLLDTQFQGQPALVFEGRTRLEHYWRAVFERSGQWYELVLWLPLPEDVPNSGYWPYLQSLQIEETATTMPVVMPATAVTVPAE